MERSCAAKNEDVETRNLRLAEETMWCATPAATAKICTSHDIRRTSLGCPRHCDFSDITTINDRLVVDAFERNCVNREGLCKEGVCWKTIR